MIAEFHKQGSAFYFALLDPEEKEIVGIANFFKRGTRIVSRLLSRVFHRPEMAGTGAHV
ncbi:Ribosomal-protein-S5p-alanine acetyltransferase [Enterobacter hormaechei]|nr:Ribosomal-protein-S5p-alanine acetyltransferase [Enterobacter hormaechei]